MQPRSAASPGATTEPGVRRRIVAFAVDDLGDWVALLDCLHRQHVRHQPPFRDNPWVLTAAGRAGRVGSDRDCPLCDRCEIPADLVVLRTTPTWDAGAMPAGLRRHHRVAAGTWGRIRVEAGALRFVAATEPVTDVTVPAGATQAIPPEVEHHVEPVSAVRFCVDFLGRPG